MQSEIDEIRACLRVLDVMADSPALTPEFVREAVKAIGSEVDKIELQQACRAGTVTVPVMTLAQVAAAAARDGRARLSLVEGGRP